MEKTFSKNSLRNTNSDVGDLKMRLGIKKEVGFVKRNTDPKKRRNKIYQSICLWLEYFPKLLATIAVVLQMYVEHFVVLNIYSRFTLNDAWKKICNFCATFFEKKKINIGYCNVLASKRQLWLTVYVYV